MNIIWNIESFRTLNHLEHWIILTPKFQRAPHVRLDWPFAVWKIRTRKNIEFFRTMNYLEHRRTLNPLEHRRTLNHLENWILYNDESFRTLNHLEHCLLSSRRAPHFCLAEPCAVWNIRTWNILEHGSILNHLEHCFLSSKELPTSVLMDYSQSERYEQRIF